MQTVKLYSPYQFSFFRLILGLYLCIHFVHLLPYAAEIWSDEGILADPSLNLTYGVFPNVLYWLSSPLEVSLFVGLAALLSFCLLIGFQRPIVSLLLWYCWVCLFDRNNLINNPGIPYVGWLLLCCAALPKGEPLSVTKGKEKWAMPSLLFVGAWALMAIGYTISGVDKFLAPSWRDGTAIFHLLENPLARDWWLRELILLLPLGVIKIKTWAVLLMEILFLPLALWEKTRKWIWLGMIGMHLGILMIVDFADLTLGMLMIHWFTFDSSWLKAKPKHTGILFFDGVCGMCNSIVDMLLTEDQGATLRYAPLQGSTAREQLEEKEYKDLDSIVYLEGGVTYRESEAVLRALLALGGFWRLFSVFLFVPRVIRDVVYRFIAKNRYRIFGKKEACRMPSPEERARILM